MLTEEEAGQARIDRDPIVRLERQRDALLAAAKVAVGALEDWDTPTAIVILTEAVAEVEESEGEDG